MQRKENFLYSIIEFFTGKSEKKKRNSSKKKMPAKSTKSRRAKKSRTIRRKKVEQYDEVDRRKKEDDYNDNNTDSDDDNNDDVEPAKDASVYRYRVKSKSRKSRSLKRSRKSKVRIPIHRGGLAIKGPGGKIKQEYHIHLATSTRRAILGKLMKREGGLSIMRALVARRTLGKHNLNQTQKEILTRDINYVKKQHAKSKK